MPRKVKFDRIKVFEKTSKTINYGQGFKYGGLVALGAGGVMSFAELSKARSPFEMKMAISTLVGGIIAGFTVGLVGQKMNSTVMKKLIGKPYVCRKIANDIVDKKQRLFIRAIGHIDWKNKTVRDAFRVTYVSGKATQVARNVVER